MPKYVNNKLDSKASIQSHNIGICLSKYAAQISLVLVIS